MDLGRHCSDPSPPAGLGAGSEQAQLPTWPSAWNVSWDTARTQVWTAEPGALSSYSSGPHPLPLTLPSNQGTLVTDRLPRELEHAARGLRLFSLTGPLKCPWED